MGRGGKRSFGNSVSGSRELIGNTMEDLGLDVPKGQGEIVFEVSACRLWVFIIYSLSIYL